MLQGCFAGFGETMLRLNVPAGKRLGEAVPGYLETGFGGAEANVCTSLALLGNPVRYLTALPAHPLTDALERQMRGYGVETQWLRRPAGRFGTYYVEPGCGCRPSQVWYDRAYSAIALAGPEEYDFAALLDNVGCLHLTGITPGLSENACRSTLALAGEARRRHIIVSCDVNYRSKLWRWRDGSAPQELARHYLTELAGLAEILIVNVTQARELFELHRPSEADNCFDLEAARSTARQLMERFPQLQLLALPMRETLSAEHNNLGVMLLDGTTGEEALAPTAGTGSFQPYQLRQMADRIGGGDAFAAGLLHARFGRPNRSLSEVAGFAIAAGCLKHSFAGDVNRATEAEIEQLMNGGNSRVCR